MFLSLLPGVQAMEFRKIQTDAATCMSQQKQQARQHMAAVR
jgi:hypothetical protein